MNTPALTPEEVKMIQDAAKEFCKLSDKSPDVTFSHSEYSLAGLMAYHEGARLGINLERIRSAAIIADLTKRLEEAERDQLRMSEIIESLNIIKGLT